MNLFDDINKLDKLIKDLTYKLTYSKDKKFDADVINTLIDTRNNYNNILLSKYYLDSLDALILDNVLLRLRRNGKGQIGEMGLHIIFSESCQVMTIKDATAQKFTELCSELQGRIEKQFIENEDFDKLLTTKASDYAVRIVNKMLQIYKNDLQWSIIK